MGGKNVEKLLQQTGVEECCGVANGEINSIRKESTLVVVPLNDFPLFLKERSFRRAVPAAARADDSDKNI